MITYEPLEGGYFRKWHDNYIDYINSEIPNY